MRRWHGPPKYVIGDRIYLQEGREALVVIIKDYKPDHYILANGDETRELSIEIKHIDNCDINRIATKLEFTLYGLAFEALS